jgi:hypothetical protein
MNHPNGPADDRLIARLSAIAREVDPPAPMVYELGHQMYGFHRIDDELAELVVDSRLDSHAVRAAASDTRLLSFEGSGATIEIEVTREGMTYSILGQLTRADSGPVGGRAFLETPGGPTRSSVIDSHGRFEFTGIPDTLARFRVETAGAPSVTTAWTEL